MNMNFRLCKCKWRMILSDKVFVKSSAVVISSTKKFTIKIPHIFSASSDLLRPTLIKFIKKRIMWSIFCCHNFLVWLKNDFFSSNFRPDVPIFLSLCNQCSLYAWLKSKWPIVLINRTFESKHRRWSDFFFMLVFLSYFQAHQLIS